MSASNPRSSTNAKATSGLSTTGRVVLALAALLSLSLFGRAALDVYGFRPLGYRGRAEFVYSDATADLKASLDEAGRYLGLWFLRCEDDARAIGWNLRRLPGYAAMKAAPLKMGEESEDLSLILRAGLSRNGAYREISFVDGASGRVVSSSSPSTLVPNLALFAGNHRMLILPDGSWVFPVSLDDADRTGDWLCFTIDPGAFLRQILPDMGEQHRSIQFALVGYDGRVLESVDSGTFRRFEKAVPSSDLGRLLADRVASVRVGDREFVAAISDLIPVSEGGARLLAAVDRATIDRPLLGETLASIALNLFFSIGIIAVAWFMVRKVFWPFEELSAAVREFALGGSPTLPVESRGEIGFLSGAFGDLMTRVSEQRQNLEREIESKTSDLLLRNAAIKALALAGGDDVAYRSMLSALCSGFGVDLGLAVYFDGGDGAKAVFVDDTKVRSLTSGQVAKLEEASSIRGGPLRCLGRDFAGCVGSRQTVERDLVGLVFLGRSVGEFRPLEAKLLGASLEGLAPLLFERRERSRQEEIRASAERALRRSEERLRTFFEESGDMIYTANAEDTVASINAAGLRLLGAKDRFDVVGRKFSQLALSREDREEFLRQLRADGYVNDYEIVLKKADGRTAFCIETAHSIRSRDGTIVEIQGIVKDISDRINKERELWKANLELSRANNKLRETQMLVVQREKLASIGQLAAGIAHEINNPLGFLKSNHEVLRRYLDRLRAAWGEAKAFDAKAFGEIEERLDLAYVFNEFETLVGESDEGYRRIIEIVKNLRIFAREDSTGEMASYDVEEGIKSTLIVARNEVKYVAEVELSLGGLPPISASGGEINQVLLNLVMNAAQAIDGQGRSAAGRILISSKLVDGQAVILVEDDGPGIPEELRLRIFDPFFTTKAPGKGTGLGLSISYDIVVNKHGGSLSVVDSSLGGAAFRLALPVDGPARDPSGEEVEVLPAE